MKTIELKRFPYGPGWQYRIRTGYSAFAGQTWSNANSIEEIRKSYPDLPFEYFAPDDRTRITHLNVKMNQHGIISAMENFNTGKVRAWELSELWPEEERYQFIRKSMTDLPDEIDTADKALTYAKAWNSSATIDGYNEEAKNRVKTELTMRMGPNIEIEITE